MEQRQWNSDNGTACNCSGIFSCCTWWCGIFLCCVCSGVTFLCCVCVVVCVCVLLRLVAFFVVAFVCRVSVGVAFFVLCVLWRLPVTSRSEWDVCLLSTTSRRYVFCR